MAAALACMMLQCVKKFARTRMRDERVDDVSLHYHVGGWARERGYIIYILKSTGDFSRMHDLCT